MSRFARRIASVGRPFAGALVVDGGVEARQGPDLLAVRAVRVDEGEARPVAPAPEPAVAEERAAPQPVRDHAPDGLGELPAGAVVVVVLAVKHSRTFARLPVIRHHGVRVEVHLVGVAVAVSVVVHAAHPSGVGGDHLADELVVGALPAGDALHLKRRLRVLAVDAAVARVGLVDCPVVVAQELGEGLLLEAAPVHEGAGALRVFVETAWRRLGERGDVRAPRAVELVEVALVALLLKPLAVRRDGLFGVVEARNVLVVDLPLEDAVVALRHGVGDASARIVEDVGDDGRVEEAGGSDLFAVLVFDLGERSYGLRPYCRPDGDAIHTLRRKLRGRVRS